MWNLCTVTALLQSNTGTLLQASNQWPTVANMGSQYVIGSVPEFACEALPE